MDLMSGSRPKPEAEAAGALDHRLLDILAHAANDFIALPSSGIGDTIDRTLREIGELFAVDRAYLFEISADGGLMSNTHEWCGQGVQPEKANLQDVPTTICPWWMGTLQAGGTINLRSLDDLPPEASGSRAILEPQGIQSLLALPVIRDGHMIGFAGFDHVRSRRSWRDLEISILRLVISLFAQAFERARTDQRLLLATAVFDHAQEGIFVTNAEQRILEVNPGFTQITGYPREEALGRTPNMLSSGRHGPDFYEAMWGALHATGHWRGELWNRRSDGELYLETLTISTVRDDAGRVINYVGVFQDITRLKQQEERLEQMAYFDSLTKLPNRTLLADRMKQALAQSHRAGEMMAVCYLDLDRFKPVNDQHGHPAGDRLLVEMSNRLKGALRAGDTVARLGGDEFVLLLQGLHSQQECEHALGRVLACVHEPWAVTREQSVTLSASIGYRLVPPHDADPDTLLRQADRAMYAAKQEGRGRFHRFDPERDQRVVRRQDQIAQLGRAMDAGELVLHFQPIVDLRRGDLRLAEALVRWAKPDRGLLKPGSFLPLVEDHEFIVQLGSFVLERALASCQRWHEAGIRIGVSVNVAAMELRDADFVPRLDALLARHAAIDPSLLKLEVVESSALGDMSAASQVIAACARRGVQFSLDDFGTGYSSLTYLKRLPTASLKIDQSFVANMLHDDGDRAIVTGVIELARVFGRASIAEGVETPAHMHSLRELGCDMAQGFGIAAAMPEDRFVDWCRRWPERQTAVMGLGGTS